MPYHSRELEWLFVLAAKLVILLYTQRGQSSSDPAIIYDAHTHTFARTHARTHIYHGQPLEAEAERPAVFR